MFRTDPHEEGIFAGWEQPGLDEAGWALVDTTRPFYRQGYDDWRGYPYVGHIWYRLKLDMPAVAQDKKVMLCVPVVVTEAWCWVNGHYAGHRPYQEAYVRPAEMELDVTEFIRTGQTNVITIRVDTSLSAAQAAEGIQSRVMLYAQNDSNVCRKSNQMDFPAEEDHARHFDWTITLLFWPRVPV